MIERLVDQIEARFNELSEQLANPDVISDRTRYAEVGRQYRALEPAQELAREYTHLASDAAGARELLAEDGDDPELRELLRTSEARLAELEEEIRLAMVEPDPNDEKNVIVEVRAGTGGEEAGLFAGDLYRMLTRYAERRGFKLEPLSVADGERDGDDHSSQPRAAADRRVVVALGVELGVRGDPERLEADLQRLHERSDAADDRQPQPAMALQRGDERLRGHGDLAESRLGGLELMSVLDLLGRGLSHGDRPGRDSAHHHSLQHGLPTDGSVARGLEVGGLAHASMLSATRAPV